MINTARLYYRLLKPGLVYGNALMYVAGFFLASRHGLNWPLFFEGLIGLSLIIGSACAFNNYADRELDTHMARTRGRSLAAGEISGASALIYATVLFLIGALILHAFTTPVALAAGLVGFVVYVFIYTPMKPVSGYALFAGAVAGAMPPVVGYTAVTGAFDNWALLLFVLLFIWQIPHFIAIATYRFEDYKAAGVPVLARAPKTEAGRRFARGVFFASLIILLVACLAVALWRIFTLMRGA